MAPDSHDLQPSGVAWAADEPESVATPAVRPLIERLVGSPGVRSGYVSLVAHVLACLVLALIVFEHRPRPRQRPILVAFDAPGDEDPGIDPVDHVAMHAVAGGDAPSAEAGPAAAAADWPAKGEARAEAAGAEGPLDGDLAAALTAVADVGALLPIAASVAAPQAGTTRPPTPAEETRAGPPAGERVGGGLVAVTAADGFATRRGRLRGETAAARGGSAASEAAVERGLAWLALHQAVDGSWRFDLSGSHCDGGCRDPGTIDSSTASTAIALLPFLGAGNTHSDGPHQQTVSRGIYYLINRMQSTPRGGDFCEGTMYGHGVTTLALAEALGMTRDEFLAPYVRDAVRFIETSQDLHGGGWRYLPGQAGDMTVTAWQLAALKSASLAGVAVPSPTVEGVGRFLDRLQTQKGAAYGYRTPAAKPCTSAIGLLCRMYTGWDARQEALVRGVTNLAKPGPSPTAVYQNFYLSQALLQLDHPVWPRWNSRNRDQIVHQQARFGHEAGSWFFADHDTAPGGRLAHTALAILTLEVYYRLLPIFRQEAVAGGF